LENNTNSEVIIFEDKNGEISLDVSLENNTVWLSSEADGVTF